MITGLITTPIVDHTSESIAPGYIYYFMILYDNTKVGIYHHLAIMHANPVVVSLHDLKEGGSHLFLSVIVYCVHDPVGNVALTTLEAAFDSNSLGILIVKDLEPEYSSLRHKLLSYASYLANLPSEDLRA